MIVDVIASVREGESASNSAGGTSPSAWCRRPALNRPRYATTASSSCELVRQTRVGDQLGLKAVDKALGQRVVVGIADRPDAGEDAVIGERPLPYQKGPRVRGPGSALVGGDG
jgi:hypothetical protein